MDTIIRNLIQFKGNKLYILEIQLNVFKMFLRKDLNIEVF